MENVQPLTFFNFGGRRCRRSCCTACRQTSQAAHQRSQLKWTNNYILKFTAA